jgi:hypothetical protein
VAAGNAHFADGHTAESVRAGKPPKAPGVAYGKTSENRSYLRWENPVLGINGEGRVSPIIAGCQQITSVIAPDGELLVHNKLWRTPKGTEGGGSIGQRGIDMAPAAPRTTDRKAREFVLPRQCEDSGIWDSRRPIPESIHKRHLYRYHECRRPAGDQNCSVSNQSCP